MGRSIGKIKTGGLPMPVVPTENKGIMSGPIRKPKRQGRRMMPRGSVKPSSVIGQRPLRRGEKEFMDRLTRDREAGITRTPEEESKLYKEMVSERRGPIGRRRPPDVGPFPDPTLGGPPEREVPIPKERPIRIEDGQKNFFETMFERADNKRQMRDIEKGERRDRQEAMRDEARMRDSERGGGRKMRDDDRGGRRKKEDRGGRRMRDDDRGGRNKRRRRRDFTKKRSRMEGRRSREERGAFRDKYVSTLKR